MSQEDVIQEIQDLVKKEGSLKLELGSVFSLPIFKEGLGMADFGLEFYKYHTYVYTFYMGEGTPPTNKRRVLYEDWNLEGLLDILTILKKRNE